MILKTIALLVLLIQSLPSVAAEEGVADLSTMKKNVAGIFYYQNIFGLVHQNPSRYSMSLTTLACGHPVQVYQLSSKEGKPVYFPEDFVLTKVGPYDGYMPKDYLENSRPNCFQDKFPKFFENFDLELSDLYYCGRLYDHYLLGKSKVH
ncbi:MAG: hypothetical protein WCG27_02035 [Pseudomonadota bacterium]